MTDEKSPAPPRTVEAPMTSFVRGGTVSSAYELDQQRKKADAERRRNEEAARFQAAKAEPHAARIRTANLGGDRKDPVVILEIRNSDGKAEEFIKCELLAGTTEDPTELVLCMACPACARRYGQSEANMKFSNKHKRFELDVRRQGELWVNPLNPREFYTLAGTIHLTEAVTCPGLGCGWRFKIDNSVVRTL